MLLCVSDPELIEELQRLGINPSVIWHEDADYATLLLVEPDERLWAWLGFFPERLYQEG